MSDKTDNPVATHALLRAEVMRLQNQCEHFQAERDALRAENDLLSGDKLAIADRCLKLEAENERLRSDVAELRRVVNHCGTNMHRLEDENEQLRAALEQIGNLKEVNDDTLTDAVMLASRVLVSDKRA